MAASPSIEARPSRGRWEETMTTKPALLLLGALAFALAAASAAAAQDAYPTRPILLTQAIRPAPTPI
jgi:hypothetical protein